MGRTSIAVRWIGVAAALLAALAAVPAASAAPVPKAAAPAELQRLLEQTREQYSAPGAAITYGDGDYDVTLSRGTRDLFARHRIESSDLVRVGSDTKMFVAVVVLQLVAEHRLDLDSPIDRYLPGVLRYPRDKVPGDPAKYDGRTVTVRQLLQHTSGVPDYANDYVFVFNPVNWIVPPTEPQIVSYAVAKGPTHLPGKGWVYSNTDYTLLGMAVRRVTGHGLSTEIAQRIARPLGLRRTFFPEPGQKGLPGSHVSGYLTELAPIDITGFEPAVFGAAGALVSTADDMNTFITALLDGELLAPAQLRQMQTTVPYLAGGYGLGIVEVPLSCGPAWGHSGQVAGYQTSIYGTASGRHAFLVLNSTYPINVVPPANPKAATELLDRALCG